MCPVQTTTDQVIVVTLNTLVPSGLYGIPVGRAAIELGQLVGSTEQGQSRGGILQSSPVSFRSNLFKWVLGVIAGGLAVEDVVGVVVNEWVSLNQMSEGV